MPAIFKHTDCPVCGHRHHFCFNGDDHVPGRQYDYVCPENGKKGSLSPAASAEIAHMPPQGAVMLEVNAATDGAPGN